MSERDPGETFPIESIGFIDFETIGPSDIKQVGTYKYLCDADAVMVAYAIGRGDVQLWASEDLSPLAWDNAPDELRAFSERVERGEARWCAHSAAFDRGAWNFAAIDFPPAVPEHFIDTAVQASASGLPAALGGACRYLGIEGKIDAGKELIKLFHQGATPQSHPEEWAQFGAYCRQDVAAMRDVFRHTRQLPFAEWCEYWAAEVINERGVGFDVELAGAADRMSQVDKRLSAIELKQLTGGAVPAVTMVKRMVDWLRDNLDAGAREILLAREEEIDEDTGEVIRPEKNKLTRNRVVALLAYLASKAEPSEIERKAIRVLEIRRYGGSTAPAKFGKMLIQGVDGVLMGQYVFNGAPQTGRFSAKGVQIHNLTRDALPYEMDALDSLLRHEEAHQFATVGDDTPISRKLALLVRPALVARQGKVFCWSDWEQIEARITPWLADSAEAEERLDIFRACDADPSLPDLYTRSAAEISHISIEEVTKPIRQRGKVAELALGFGGSVGALQSMGAGYGIHIEADEARETVDRWREVNQWAVRFWGRYDDNANYGLWGAINTAMNYPGQMIGAGRVGYIYLKDYLGGSVLCMLPSGRFLTYRRIKWERVEIRDPDTDEIVDVRRELMFGRQYGRIKLWPGLCCENVVQATAADILRGTIRRLVDRDRRKRIMPVRFHTHDEIGVECSESDVNFVREYLSEVMVEGFEWSDGLPLKSGETIARWYSKCEAAWGL